VHLNLWRAQQLARQIGAPLAHVWYSIRKPLAGVAAIKRPRHFLDYATGGLGAVRLASDGLPFYYRNGLLGPRLTGARLPDRELPWSHEAALRVLDEYLEFEHNVKFRCEYMTKVDGGTMFYALEARSPFLDQEIWNYAATLQYDVRLHNNQLKPVLREIARRRLGERVATGSKRGFTIPVLDWIAGRWNATIAETFRESRLAADGWLDRDALVLALEEAARRGVATNHLWYCYILETWYRNEYVPVSSGPPASGLETDARLANLN
jgi:asparagine synthase (glutamine-hydrolysing)